APQPMPEQLEETLGRGDVLQQMLAEIARLERVEDEVARDVRQQHLLSMRGCTDARGAREVDADVVPIGGQRRLSSVQPDPYAHLVVARVLRQRALRVGGGGDSS